MNRDAASSKSKPPSDSKASEPSSGDGDGDEDGDGDGDGDGNLPVLIFPPRVPTFAHESSSAAYDSRLGFVFFLGELGAVFVDERRRRRLARRPTRA